MQYSIRRALFLLLFSSFTLHAFGADFAPAPVARHVDAALVSSVTSIAPGAPFTVALVLTMDPDWHVYWKNPGDSGLPTSISWSLPPGFTVGELQWPVPERFVNDGRATYGYSESVLLLAVITPPRTIQPGARLTIGAKAEWLACKVECIPGAADLSLTLPAGRGVPGADPRWGPAIDAT
ncbi:MAG TPA: protein-disulfide reductase DsbD domain-containing protein, partial [Spirochaetia bacterium]